MDLILYNGRLYSMENETAIYQAIAIHEGKIYAIGQDNDILNLKTNKTELIDLDGKILLPGFNDSHMHLMGYGAALSQVELSSARSIKDVVSLTKAFIEENQLPENSWVMGRGWNQDHFPTPLMPCHFDLDQISKKHYICLRRVCGHVATVNTAVLEHLNLSTELTHVKGGEYYEGIFKENAFDLVMNQVPDPTHEEMVHWILKAVKKLHTMGITSVQSDDLCVLPEHMTKDTLKVYETLSLENKLPLRVYEQALFRTTEHFLENIEKGYVFNKSFGTFKYGPLKVLGDGSLGGRTAWLRNSYNDADTKGIHMYEQEVLNTYIKTAHDHNIASAIHCIGDAMLDSALEAIEKAQFQNPKPLKHAIVHCQITHLSQLEKMKELEVMALVQPIFLDYDVHIVYDRVGQQLAESSYNWKTMTTLGLNIAFGSDAPVETPDPIKGIHCAVTRQDLKGLPEHGYLKEEALPVYEALYRYTAAGAIMSNDDDHKGFLKPGYLADCVVLEGNIFESILNTSVFMTIFDGKIVFKKQ